MKNLFFWSEKGSGFEGLGGWTAYLHQKCKLVGTPLTPGIRSKMFGSIVFPEQINRRGGGGGTFMKIIKSY